MAMPMSSGSADSKVMAPVTDSACTIPTAAEADCRMAVNTAPTRMPSRGLDRDCSVPVNQGILPRPDTAPLMVLMPNISTAKPIRMSPMWRRSFFLENTRSKTPAMATRPVRVAVENTLNMPDEPSK